MDVPIFETALVTGATGFIGSHFLARLTDDFPGIRVRSASRHLKEAGLRNRPVEYVAMDLHGRIELGGEADIVFHIAGEIRDRTKMWAVNVEGTRRLLDWAAGHGAKRFVYVSSVGVYGAGKDSRNIDEQTPRHPKNSYEASKNAAENLVRDGCSRSGIDYVILQPSNVIGLKGSPPYHLLNLMRIVKRGLFTYFDDGNGCLNYVPVEAVSNALAAAMSPRAAGATFIVNCPTRTRMVIDWIADELGVPRPQRRWPASVGYLAAEMAGALAALTGISMPFGKERYDEITRQVRYEGSAIVDRLGYRYDPGLEAAIRRLVRHYAGSGLL